MVNINTKNLSLIRNVSRPRTSLELGIPVNRLPVVGSFLNAHHEQIHNAPFAID